MRVFTEEVVTPQRSLIGWKETVSWVQKMVTNF